MEIEEVAQILGLCSFLRVPKHVFITDEPVRSKKNGETFYRGLQPKSRGDAIFITRDGDVTTPIHEAIHAQLGLGEPGTEILTRLILRKIRLARNFPILAAQRIIRYRKVESSKEFSQAHDERFIGRVEHYVLV